MGDDNLLKGIEKDIEEILFSYIQAESFTNSQNEKQATEFLLNYFSDIPYFKNTPGSYGSYPIENDPLDREVFYAALRGKGRDTVVFVHHSDIVGVEDFKLLKEYAFSPEKLKAELMKIKDSLSKDAQKDLNEDTFLFGRGVCDMKGGGAIQIALLKNYSRLSEFKGNIVLIAVPDEENLSAGMRSAVKLMDELKEKYDFNYKIMINSEPHQRKDFTQGIFSEGSVGKIMPFIYVRGVLAHAGKVFEGLNPLHIMSGIVRKTEINMELCDVVGNEASPPPTWLYLRDSKDKYDVSMPLGVKGCFSILTLNQTPQSILDKVRNICRSAFDEVIADMNKSYRKFAEATGLQQTDLPWVTKVVNFSELCDEARAGHGKEFEHRFKEKKEELGNRLRKNKISIIDANFEIIEFIYDYVDDISPRVVYGLLPPYYPNVSNLYFDNLDSNIKSLSESLMNFTEKEFGQTYTREYFYTGISDLSYTDIKRSEETQQSLRLSMPLLGEFYNIPADTIERVSMPCMNIGPWGKDFHKLTERVCKEDLYVRTPIIIKEAIALILGNITT